MLSHIKMGKLILTFGDIEIPKHKFCRYNSPLIFQQILTTSQYLTRFHLLKNHEYFIGYLYDNFKIKLLHIMLSKMSACVKRYDGQIKWMYQLIEDDGL